MRNEEVETNVDFKLFKSNDHNSYTERNDECKVGAEKIPSAEEHKQNDETRSHSGKLCSVIWSSFIILKMSMVMKTFNEVIADSRKSNS